MSYSDSSNVLNQLKVITKSMKSEKDNETKFQYVMQFLINFEEFICIEKNQAILKKNVPGFVKDLLDIIKVILIEKSSILSSMKILSLVNQFYEIPANNKQLIPLFISFLSSLKLLVNIPDVISDFCKYLVSEDSFFGNLVKSGGIKTILQNCYFINSSAKITNFINSLFFEYSSATQFQNISYNEIIQCFVEQNNDFTAEDNLSGIAYFISNFVYRMSNTVKNATTIFISSKGIDKFDELIDKIKGNDKLNYYRELLKAKNDDFSPSPNILFLKHAFYLFKKYPKYQISLFILMAEMADTRQSIQIINNITPFVGWLCFQEPNVNLIINFLSTLNGIAPETVPSFLTGAFSAIMTKQLRTIDLNIIASVIDTQLNLCNFDYSFLMRAGFYEIFFEHTSNESLFFMVNQGSHFKDILLKCYSIQSSTIYQPKMFSKLLQLHEFYKDISMYISLITEFLLSSPLVANIKSLIKVISELKNIDLLSILSNSFVKRYECSKNFVHAGGLKWILEESDFKIESKIELLSNLVYYKGFKAFENIIQNLPQKHPLFSLPEEQLKRIIYGNNERRYKPIKVYTLVKYISKIPKLDPYNSYYLGSRFLNLYKDIYDAPMLKQICNRNISLEQVDLLCKKPSKLYNFANISYDHFPLIQMFPGSKPICFSKDFQCLSFWFKYNASICKSDTFKLDNIEIKVEDNKLIFLWEEQSQTMKIESKKWNHLLIQLKPSMMGFLLKFYVNGNVFRIQSKLKPFTTLSILHVDDNILFIGPGIRFFNCYVPRLKLLYKKGPQFLKICSSDETLISPYLLPQYQHQSNFFIVPYFGFSLYCNSKTCLQKFSNFLSNSSTSEEYESLIQLFLNLQRINGTDIEYYNILFSSLKLNNNFLNSSMFSKFLISEKIIPLILYDKKLWKSIDHSLLIESLMKSYPNFEWKKFQNIELFFISIVLENDSKSIINTLLGNIQKIPNFLKYLIVLLKVAPVLCQSNLTWDSVKFREEVQLQDTIIDCLIEFTDNTTANLMNTLLPFEEIKYLFVSSPPKLSVSIFKLITHFVQINPNYARFDSIFNSIIPSICCFESPWHDIMKYIELPENTQITFLPLYLMFIFCGSLCKVHQYNYKYPDTEFLDMISNKITTIISHCTTFITKIFSDPESFSVVLNWFPMIVHYSMLFQPLHDSQNKEVQSAPIMMSIQQFSELFDPIWFDSEKIIREVTFPNPPNPPKASHFMFEKISMILSNNGFTIPFPANPTGNANNWLFKSSLLSFITDLILMSSNNFTTLMDSFFYSYILYNPQTADSLTTIFINSLLGRLGDHFTQLNNTPIISNVLNFIHILTGLQYLQDSSLYIISDLFTLATIIESKAGESGLLKYSPQIQPILLSLFSSLPVSLYELVFTHFAKNISLFMKMAISQSALHAWLYAFLVASYSERIYLNNFLTKLSTSYQFSKEDSDIIEKLINKTLEKDINSFKMLEKVWKTKSHEFQVTYKTLYDNIKKLQYPFLGDISNISQSVTNFNYLSNAKHYITARLFSHTLLYLTNSFLIREEANQWKDVTKSLLFNKNNEEVLSYHVWPFGLPNSIPNVLIPSIFPQINIEILKNIRSVPIKHYKQNILYQYSNGSDLQMNMLKIFSEMYEIPLFVSNCTITRFNLSIPSVILFFDKYTAIIFDCKLNDSMDDFNFKSSLNTKYLHVFLESIFVGNWGETEMFASKIFIQIPYNSIIFSHKMNESSIAIWTTCSGNFIISCQKKEIFTKLLRLNKANYLINLRKKLSDFCDGNLSSFEFLLFINLFGNRSFYDLKNYPIAPKLPLFKDEILSKQTYPYPLIYQSPNIQDDEIPINILAEPEYIQECNIKYTIKLRNDLELMDNTYTILNFCAEKFNCGKDISFTTQEVNGNFLNTILDVKLLHCHKSQQKFKEGKSFFLISSKISQYPIQTKIVQNSFLISIEPNYLCMTLYHKKLQTSSKIFSPLFYYVNHIYPNKSGQFLSIDYSIGITEIWKIKYQNEVPYTLKSIKQKGFSCSNQKTIISSHYGIAVTACQCELIFWNIFLLNNIRIINYDLPIKFIDFEDSLDAIWIVTPKFIELITINGVLISHLDIEINITAICPIDFHGHTNIHSLLVGDCFGNIYIVKSFSTDCEMQIYKLPKSHEFLIRQFHVHHSFKIFISVDEYSNVFIWKI